MKFWSWKVENTDIRLNIKEQISIITLAILFRTYEVIKHVSKSCDIYELNSSQKNDPFRTLIKIKVSFILMTIIYTTLK